MNRQYEFKTPTFHVYLNFIKHRNVQSKPDCSGGRQRLNEETERLVNEVRKELHALRREVEQKGNAKLLKRYQELRATLD